MIPFYDEKHCEIIAVFADAVIGKNLVTLTVFYNDEAFEKRGESAVARWNKLRRSIERKGLLIDPTAQYQDKQERGMYNNEDSMKKLDDLRKIRREYIDSAKKAPAKSDVLSMAGISRYLLIKYAPDLFKNWKVVDYE